MSDLPSNADALTRGLLHEPPSNLVNGVFRPLETEGSGCIVSHDPAEPETVVWRGVPNADHLEEAIAAARSAQPGWQAMGREKRIECLRRWQEVTTARKAEVAELITREMGKVLSESLFEAGALAGKVDIALDEQAASRTADYEVKVNDTRDGYCRFKPHGVMAVLGPFNFPAHLPNGHFVPALIAGNTVILKPSEKTPAVGQALAEMAVEAGFPAGVFNLVQGGSEIASTLSSHEDIDGVLFTGSWGVGRRILEANLDSPGRIVALELGGSNPSVVMPSADLRQAVVECARAAFATTGQRCTCTRRIILHRSISDQFISALGRVASTLMVGPGLSTDPIFMGPLATGEAVDEVLAFQSDLHAAGADILVESTRIDGPGHFITPGVVLVDRFRRETDTECFGPLVQLSIVDSFDDAIEQANATRYGLAASIFTQDDGEWERFLAECRSGCINRNTGTAGASSKLPFGGLGQSGNHRPAAAFSGDYCAYPVASMVEQSTGVAIPPGMQARDNWFS